MINVDTRILYKVNGDEYWLLTHLIKFLGKKESVWPSNKTLCKDTGWSIDKLQKVKKSLLDKGLISIEVKFNTSNVYRFHTKLIKIFIDVDGQELEEKQSTVKTNRQSVGESGKQSTVKTNNEVLVNEVLVSEFTFDSKESIQKPLSEESFQLSIETAKNGSKAKKESDFPEYGKFIEIWMDSYKTIGIRMPRDGAKIKSIIIMTREILVERSMLVNLDNMVEFWKIFISNLKITWGHGKDLSTIESKYKSLVFDLENGKSKITSRGPTTWDIINNL